MLPGKFEWLLYISSTGITGLFIFLPLLCRVIDKFWPEISRRMAILLTIWRSPGAFFRLLLLSVSLNCILITILIMLAKDIGIHLPAAYYFAIFPLTEGDCLLR
jgi:hypothetical protein